MDAVPDFEPGDRPADAASLEAGVRPRGSGRLTRQAHSGGYDDEPVRLQVIYAQTRDPRLRAELVAHYDTFAVRLARTFSSQRETTEDLIQVARLALIHAVDRFDPGRERPFVAFARVTILGELKRHLRDHTWRIRPGRTLQEHYLIVIRTVDDLTQQLGRSPRIPEVAVRAGLSEDHVLEAMDVARASPMSLDHPPAGEDGATIDPGEDDPGFTRAEDHLLLQRAVAHLPEREQHILRLRFHDELTQAQIATHLGVSQMHISRILARILTRIRTHLDPTTEPRLQPRVALERPLPSPEGGDPLVGGDVSRVSLPQRQASMANLVPDDVDPVTSRSGFGDADTEGPGV
jgi:RNA polymerase sigma-B factor